MLKVLLKCSDDEASVNIHSRLLELGDFEKVSKFDGLDVHLGHGLLLYQAEGLHLYLDEIDERIRSHFDDDLKDVTDIQSGSPYSLDLLVFLSKHRSEMELNSLTVHPPGNYITADHGGVLGHLPPSSPIYMSSALRSLYREKKALGIKDQTTYEVTHHGPFVNSPCFFIEIGSTKERWGVPSLGGSIAKALLSEGFLDPNGNIPAAIGIGGGHYGPRFTDRAMRGKFNFGHMIPDYVLLTADDIQDVIKKAWEATPGASGAFLHRSGRNEEKMEEIEIALDALGIEELRI